MTTKELILEKLVLLQETIEALDPLLEEQRQKLESDRDQLIRSLNRHRGNPHGNAKACKDFRFKPVDPDNPLNRQITMRVTERQHKRWTENRQAITQRFRELLEAEIN